MTRLSIPALLCMITLLLTGCKKGVHDIEAFSLPLRPSSTTQPNDLNLLKPYLDRASQSDSIYMNPMSSREEIKEWQLEGTAKTEFKDGWMHMWSPEEEGHHVLWCPEIFPESFLAQWTLQNMEDFGLCIIFFAATGRNGEDVLDPALSPRDGTFRQYIVGELNSYHISYFAHARHLPKRPTSHLRKNHGFHLVSKGPEGIAWNSTNEHLITLIKDQNRILLFVDDRKIIDYLDESEKGGPAHGAGQIGFRQMQWTHFRYRDFEVWALPE